MKRKTLRIRLLLSCAAVACVKNDALAQVEPARAAAIVTKPVPVDVSGDLIMYDWDGTPTLFRDRPSPVRFLVYFSPQPGLDLSKLDFPRILTYFQASALWSEGKGPAKDFKPISKDQIVLRTGNHRSLDSWWGSIEILPKQGWPEGNVIVTGSFDVPEIERETGVRLNVPASAQATQLRFLSRNGQTGDDKLLRLRFELVRQFSSKMYDAGEVPHQQEAAEALLKEFPEDLYGHSYLGLMAYEVACTGAGLDYDDKSIEESLFHWKKVTGVLRANLPEGALRDPRLPEKRIIEKGSNLSKLHFESWLGMRDPMEILTYLDQRMSELQAMLVVRKLPYVLRPDDLKDISVIVKALKNDDALAKRLRDTLPPDQTARITNAEDAKLLPSSIKDDLRRSLNLIIVQPSIYDENLFKNVALRKSTRELSAKGKPVGVQNVKLNRLLLEDYFPGLLRPYQGP